MSTSKRIKQRDDILANIFVFVFIAILGLFPLNLKIFNPIKKALKDLNFSDLYYSASKNDASSLADTSIVLVNIGQLSRGEIAQQLRIIREGGAKVVGLDAMFVEPRTPIGDSLLSFEIRNNPNIVTASFLSQFNSESYELKEESLDDFRGERSGFINLFGTEKGYQTVRSFLPNAVYNGQKDESFPVAVARLADPQMAQILDERNKHSEIINYSGNREKFVAFDAHELLEEDFDPSIFENKIVLVGFMGSSFDSPPVKEDMHYTPLNKKLSGRSDSDMYGVVVHANILSTILHGAYKNELSTTWNWILAFIICYLHIMFFSRDFVENHMWFHFRAKILQLLTSILMVYVSLLTYKYLNTKIDTKPTILAILLSVDLLYFYDAIVKWLHKKTGFETYFMHAKH